MPSALTGTAQPPAKRRKTKVNASKRKVYTKTVICLPPIKNITCTTIPIPRGESRAILQQAGLVGKATIDSDWKAKDIEREITSLFGPCFGVVDDEVLSYHYLG